MTIKSYKSIFLKSRDIFVLKKAIIPTIALSQKTSHSFDNLYIIDSKLEGLDIIW